MPTVSQSYLAGIAEGRAILRIIGDDPEAVIPTQLTH
jgi:hypothetical protein